VPAETTLIVATAGVAALIGLAALVALWRGRFPTAFVEEDEPPPTPLAGHRVGELEVASGTAYGSAVRILWWVSIAAVLVGVGLTDAYQDERTAIFSLGAAGVAVVVLLHDLIPSRWRTPAVVVVEVLAALGLVTGLIIASGYGSSPFVFGYGLVAVAVSLALGPRIALAVAALATISYLGALLLDPALAEYGGPDLLRAGLAIGSVWLLAYLAGVYAAGERRMREAIIELSRTDPLTGLFNRSQLFLMLDHEVQRTRRSERGFCLLMIDLDGLKAVNDSFGHQRGDEVLRSLGGVIRRSIRAVDTAFRHGGDEFLVLLPETDFGGAFVVAEKIRLGAEEVGLTAGAGELLTSVSIGLVSCPEDGASAEELMLAADRAMYQAKSLGKNQISGNPRPRRLVGGLMPAGAGVEAAPEPTADDRPRQRAAAPVGEPAPFLSPAAESVPPAQDRNGAPPGAAAAPLAAPAATATLPRPPRAEAEEPAEDEEPDPSEFRRHIAAARLHMDPDHQIRRAMDAFLSPGSREDRG
jgi:diguanylate cyclase (GGDEF)-like protein